MFGIGDGTIEIKLDKTTFKRGDTIKGTLLLDLKKPTKAIWLRVDVVGEYYARWTEKSRSEGIHTESQTTRYYWSRNKIEENKEYPPGKSNYTFEIKIPKDITEWKTNAYGILQSVVDSATKGKEPPLRWYVQGRLDKPWKFSTVGTVDIEFK